MPVARSDSNIWLANGSVKKSFEEKSLYICSNTNYDLPRHDLFSRQIKNICEINLCTPCFASFSSCAQSNHRGPTWVDLCNWLCRRSILIPSQASVSDGSSRRWHRNVCGWNALLLITRNIGCAQGHLPPTACHLGLLRQRFDVLQSLPALTFQPNG